MKYATIILIPFLFFFSCVDCTDVETQLSQCNTEKTEIQTALHAAQAETQKKVSLLNDCTSSLDTAKTQTALCELKLNVCTGEMNMQSNYYRNVINEKDEAFEELHDVYDSLVVLKNDMVDENHLIDKAYIANYAAGIQETINSEERSYVNVLGIENKTSIEYEVLNSLKESLIFDYGRRENIGILFGLQVQSDRLDFKELLANLKTNK